MDKMSCIYLFIYIIFGTTFTGQIVCFGSSLSQILDGTQAHVRQIRSPHQLYRRMCPYGASRESCFYSQLSMFMRLHDGMDDPVHMRNIGKRGGTGDTAPADQAPSRSYPEIIDSDVIDNQEPFISDDVMNDVTDSQSKINAQWYDYITNRMKNMQQTNFLSSDIPWRSQQLEDTDASSDGDNSRYMSRINKRQIICPRGMARMRCYDKALAFYMQLLHSMGDQK